MILLSAALLVTGTAFAHTPVCHCKLNDRQIDCSGGYDDGSSAVGVTMRVIAYSGATLVTGRLDEQSRFSTPLPDRPFYLLMDAGPGEIFEVDWRDIEDIDTRIFQSTVIDATHIE